MKLTSLGNRKLYVPVASMVAIEYTDKKSAGQFIYCPVATPVTFLRSDGNCTVLKIRCSAWVMKRLICAVELTTVPSASVVAGNVFSVYEVIAATKES